MKCFVLSDSLMKIVDFDLSYSATKKNDKLFFSVIVSGTIYV